MKYKLITGLILTYSVCLMAGCTPNKTNINETESTNVAVNNEVEKITYVDIAMGTEVNQTLYTTGSDITGDIITLLTEVEEELISWRIEGSEIAKINESAGDEKGVQVSDSTREYLEATLEISKRSDGAMDPTIGKISRLWDIGGKNPQIPSDSEIQELLAGVGYEGITIDGNRIFLRENSSIDLGSVGKGLGADEVAAFLAEQEEVQSAVVAVGGSVVTYGTKPDESAWTVGIVDPRSDTEEYMGFFIVEGTNYISTSGDYEKYIEQDGIRYHHILDPKTGYPSDSGLISVTILCDNGLLSDGLSTACFVLGYEKGAELAASYGAEAVFIDSSKNVYITDGLKDQFTLTNDEYTIIG